MQKNILIVLGVLIIGGGIWYAMSDSGITEEANTNAETQREAADNKVEEKLSGLGSFGSILGFGSNVRCEFKSTYEGQTSEGTFYTDGERFRVETTIEGPETGSITSNMINDGEFAYTWGTSPNGSMAIKMPHTDVTAEVDDDFDYGTPAQDSFVDFEQEVEYDCDRWSVDNSVFVPPNDVEFISMEDMMREAMQGMPEGFEMPEGFPAY